MVRLILKTLLAIILGVFTFAAGTSPNDAVFNISKWAALALPDAVKDKTVWICSTLLALSIVYLVFPLLHWSKKKGAFKAPFNANKNRFEIEKAVYEKRNITSADLVWTGIRNDNNFLEFCLKDFSETWLIQEIPNALLTNEIKRQIRIVNRHLANKDSKETRHNSVIIILLVYRKLTIEEKTNLFTQLQLFNSTESLISKIKFQARDKTDIDKVPED